MTIELQGLVLFGHHGYLEEERRLGQRFLVDLWADLDDDAASSDDIDETVDYRHLAALVREVFAGPERLLLEALATATADGVIERFPRVTKRARASAQAGRRARPARGPRCGDRRTSQGSDSVRPISVTRAYVGMGANLGPREVTLLRAVDLLGAEPGVQVLEVSALHETAPVGNVDQPEFLNGAVARGDEPVRARAPGCAAPRRAGARPRSRRNAVGAANDRPRSARVRGRGRRRAGPRGSPSAPPRASLRARAARRARAGAGDPRTREDLGRFSRSYTDARCRTSTSSTSSRPSSRSP